MWAAAASRQNSSVFSAPFLAALVLGSAHGRVWLADLGITVITDITVQLPDAGSTWDPRLMAGGEGRWLYRGS